IAMTAKLGNRLGAARRQLMDLSRHVRPAIRPDRPQSWPQYRPQFVGALWRDVKRREETRRLEYPLKIEVS
ncbi:MAG: hypothetical protein KGM15_14095, partial [Pseudomonadota bacterium]|nr:hypothetical protein [Pseudomonadota bacterium]